MFKLLLTLYIILVSCSFSFAWSNPFNWKNWIQAPWRSDSSQVKSLTQSNLGLTPMFMNIGSSYIRNGVDVKYNDHLGLPSQLTLLELNGSLYSDGLFIKGYYTLPKTVTGSGILPTLEDTDENIQATSAYTLNSSRIELGLPVKINSAFVIEPSFVWQWINPRLDINGQLVKDTHISQAGLGLELSELITTYMSLKTKYVGTTDTSLFQVKYSLSDRSNFLSAGWSWWRFDNNTRLNGPFLELSIGF